MQLVHRNTPSAKWYALCLKCNLLSTVIPVTWAHLCVWRTQAGHTETSHLLSGRQVAGSTGINGLDAVGRTVQKLADAWTYSIMLWLLSFVLGMLKFLEPAFGYNWVTVFLVMWMGTVVGFIGTLLPVYQLFGKKVTSREERMFLRVRGVETDYANSVDADSIPLFRRIVLWGATVAACLILIATSQALLYDSLVRERVQLWTAMLPLFLLLAVVVLYLTFTKGIEPLTVVLVALIGLSIGLFTEHVRHPDAMSWTALLVPLWIVELVFAVQACYIIVQACSGRYVLERVQWVSLQIYIVSLILLVLAQVYAVAEEHPRMEDSLCWSTSRCYVAPLAMWIFSVVLFAVAFTCNFRWQLQEIAEQQGYTEPMPLSRTYQGWEPVGAKLSWWMLLGGITVLPPGRRRQRQQQQTQQNAPNYLATGYQNTEGPVHHLSPDILPPRAVESKDVELTTNTLTRRFSGELNDRYEDF